MTSLIPVTADVEAPSPAKAPDLPAPGPGGEAHFVPGQLTLVLPDSGLSPYSSPASSPPPSPTASSRASGKRASSFHPVMLDRAEGQWGELEARVASLRGATETLRRERDHEKRRRKELEDRMRTTAKRCGPTARGFCGCCLAFASLCPF